MHTQSFLHKSPDRSHLFDNSLYSGTDNHPIRESEISLA
ncbi:hypothetical protein LEP1GSC168_0780 [Leptospira santarosai str. HAI134]|nr:hypothetical protein LEP1GSC168_0780 [Leptospira santarosai str. HAI134]